MAEYTVPYNDSPATAPTPSPQASVMKGWNTGGATGGTQPTWGGGENRTPAPTQAWGSFGTYSNWSNEFAKVHGRGPDLQDEVDYWDSQAFAAVNGRAPNEGEWGRRYFGGGWNERVNGVYDEQGRFWPIPINGPNARSADFESLMVMPDAGPPWLAQGIKDWQESLRNREGVPGWLQSLANVAFDARGQAPFGQTPQAPTPPGTQTPQQAMPPEVPLMNQPQTPNLGGGQAPVVETPLMNAPRAEVARPRGRNYYDAGTLPGINQAPGWLNPDTWANAIASTYGTAGLGALTDPNAPNWATVMGTRR